MTTKWYRFTIPQIKERLSTDFYSGLNDKQAGELRKKYGRNVFRRGKPRTIVSTIAAQFKSPLVFILLFAGVVTLFLAQYVDTIVIVIALVINVIVGSIQEGRASKAFEKLKSSQEKTATVLRNGSFRVVQTEELVPGDVVLIEAGMHIPADARLIENKQLKVNESVLTGEWVGVSKDTKTIEHEAPITGQENMVWMGTLAISGSAKAVVVATGKDTSVGSIAESLADGGDVLTPLQKNIRRIALLLTLAIGVALVLILILGVLRGESIASMLLVAIAIAVAAMPEGLPAAVTVVLAIGMEKILKNGGLVRNLLAAETLGGTTVILTDKTGTLTKAEMRIAQIVTASSLNGKAIQGDDIAGNADEREVLGMAVLTSDAFVEGYDDSLSEWVVRGRPIERAIVLAGLSSGMKQDVLFSYNPKIDFLPFQSERRFSATLHRRIGYKDKRRIYITGAPEVLLENSSFVYKDKKKIKMSRSMIEEFRAVQDEKSDQGMRMIAVAYKDTEMESFSEGIKDRVAEDGDFKNLVFGGLFIIHDPVRPDVKKSIKEAQQAGASVVMVTGDNKHTARRVAITVGITHLDGATLTGDDLENMTNKEIVDAIKKIKVFARVLPHQKMRIVQALKEADEVVAMTGDGINDAPALRRADIGVAVGSGTEVAKEASDLVLLNNSFTIIVKAIEEGRHILDNLKKIVAYLLSTSFSEIFIVGGALIAGAPLPLLPAQILWTNIIEEGFMNFSFAFEPKEKNIMKRDPKSSRMQRILTKELKALIFILSLVTGVLLTGIYFVLLRMNIAIEEIRTIMFAVLSIDSIFFSFSLKDLSRPVWRINIFSNKYLLFALVGSIGALLLALFTPALQSLLSLAHMSPKILLLVLAVGIVNMTVIEVVKFIYFEKRSKR